MNRTVADPWQALIVDEPDGADHESRTDPFALLDDDTLEFAADVRRDPVGEVGAEVVLVVGAAGGLGATTLAAALALAIARDEGTVSLLDLDFETGATHAGWDVPRQRTTGDLVPVIAELRPEHLDLIAHRHQSGVDLVMAPGTAGASMPWQGPQVGVLVECAAQRGTVIVDSGRASGVHLDAVAAVASRAIVLAPATVAGIAGVIGIRARGWPASVTVALSPLRSAEMSARSFARGCGVSEVVSIPRSVREARDLLAGRWPGRGRSRLATTVATLAGRSA